MRSPARSALWLAALLAINPVRGAELPADADTWVHGARDYRTVNYATGEFLKVRSRGPRIALIRFDTGPLPAGADAGAMLSLHVSRVVAPGFVQIRPVTSAWSEGDVTFDTRPTIGSDVIATLGLTAADAGTRISVDISSLVAQWIAERRSNFGLAITADGSSADVYFGTRDVGTAPELIVPTRSVIVSHSGGDYSDPIAAAENAHAGDAWCVVPGDATAPCTMHIEEGIFVLSREWVIPDKVVVLGAGMTSTVLVADRGVEIAARARTTAISDLTIVNPQDETVARAVGLVVDENVDFEPLTLTRVGVRADGAVDNLGLAKGGDTRQGNLVDSDVSAVGGQSAIAIEVSGQSGLLDIHTSRITAFGAFGGNVGISNFEDENGGFQLTDTTVVAHGGRRAVGIAAESEDVEQYFVWGSTIVAAGSESAVAVDGGDFALSIRLDGTRIIAQSPGSATGVSWIAYGGEVRLGHVVLDSSGNGVRSQVEAGPTRVRIEASQIVAEDAAVIIGPTSVNDPAEVTIEDSVLQATEWATTEHAGATFMVSDSILDGDANIPASAATCTNVLGSDYTALGSDCLPLADGSEP